MGLDDFVTKLILLGVCAGLALGVFLVVGVPFLWRWISPILHQLTAP